MGEVFTIPADHPTAAGHFPGNPIVPGALLLERVARIVSAAFQKPMDDLTVISAKFLSPIKPGATVDVTWETRYDGGIRFSCSAAENPIMTGIIAFGTIAC